MSAYAKVEAHLARIVGDLLKVNYRKSHIIFFSVSTTRSRLELIGSLFELHLKADHLPAFRKYWGSLEAYLSKLSQFRNALAHWHPHINVYMNRAAKGPNRFEAGLSHPVPGLKNRSIEERHVRDFIEDCVFAQEILSSVAQVTKRRPRSSPRIFRQPITRRNKADLQPPPNPKAQQPPRLPSKPKLSAAQRRKKALKEARRKS
jgi:hypothetical protein